MWNEKEIREYLKRRLQLLEARQEEIERILRLPEDSDLEEQLTELSDDDVLESLARSASEEAGEIRQALQRLDSGSYGTCRSCRRRIARRRLRAFPHKTTCVRCAQSAA